MSQPLKPPSPSPAHDIVALLAVFNEELILEAALRHLADQGIGFVILDNGSTDASIDIAQSFAGRGLVRWERAPATAAGFDLTAILLRKEELALELAQHGTRWFIHQDADEFRESPWPGVSLADGLRRAAREGCNVVDHALVNFVPTDENFHRGTCPLTHFTHYLPDTTGLRHGKAWLQGRQRVNLARDGGHFVKFPGRKIFPIPFVIRHYSLLSSDHARRKIFHERKPRYAATGRAKGWHTHYDQIGENTSFIYAPDDPRLKVWNEAEFKAALALDKEPQSWFAKITGK